MSAVFSRSPRLLSYVHLHFASNPELAGRFRGLSDLDFTSEANSLDLPLIEPVTFTAPGP